MERDLGVFILSHGRPEAISLTITALRKGKWSGPWWIVLDTTDRTADAYRSRWGADRVLTFDKDDVRGTFDLGDNGGPESVVVYARNHVDTLARERGLTHYVVLDDDYTYFAHRYNQDGALTYAYSTRLDDVFAAFAEFLDASGALTVACAQGGDYIGGVRGIWRHPIKRKAMNVFVCRVGNPIGFVGRLNEDATTYIWKGSRGDLFFTVTDFAIDQKNTQEQDGGLTGAYLDLGTYVKTFYSIMWSPSSVKVSTLGENSHRVHHSIRWNNTIPRIMAPHWRKDRAEA